MQCDMGCEAEQIEQMIRHATWRSGSTGVVLGVSGGVDSALAAALCTRALGNNRVLGLLLPSRVSRGEDLQDAEDLCQALGIEYRILPIEPFLDPFRNLPEYQEDRYLEGNLMARIRMVMLYYRANRDRRLVCGTSNRSEYMLGYCTKYGDNAADIQPILHLYKKEVVSLARYVGIPPSILSKPPSAGLWPGQSDEGELGLSYATIDAALQALEQNHWVAASPEEERVLALVKKSQHKRSPPFNLLASP